VVPRGRRRAAADADGETRAFTQMDLLNPEVLKDTKT